MIAIACMLVGLALALGGEYAYRRHKGEPVRLRDIVQDLTED